MYEHRSRVGRALPGFTLALIATALLLGAVLVLAAALIVLPAPPGQATPTWPAGIELPDKLPRLPGG